VIAAGMDSASQMGVELYFGCSLEQQKREALCCPPDILCVLKEKKMNSYKLMVASYTHLYPRHE
jgi:hypothetical protein